MTAGLAAGAVSDTSLHWHAIDWQKVHGNVRRLQVRIVKAVKEGRWGKVKALQHLLTRSFSGKALAVKRVTENQGKRTRVSMAKGGATPEEAGPSAAGHGDTDASTRRFTSQEQWPGRVRSRFRA